MKVAQLLRLFGPAPLVALALGSQISPSSAQTFDCIIDPAVTVGVGNAVPGLLEEVLIKRGDVVQKGQLIASLASDVERTTVELLTQQAESQAEIEAQRARYDLIVSRLNRTRELAQSNVVPQEKLEETVAEMEVVKRELAIAEMRSRIAGLELTRARKVLEQRSIRSPITGVVVERLLFEGEFLGQDDKLATIAQLDPLHVEAFLPVEYYPDIQVGTPVRVLPNKPIAGIYEGTVMVVDRVFDAASSTFGVRVELPNPDGLLPAGHRCQLTFTTVAD
jgi:RND family efflux transporter MFP subunit